MTLFSSAFDSLDFILREIPLHDPSWEQGEGLHDVFWDHKGGADLKADMLEQQVAFIFDVESSVDSQTDETYALFRAAHIGGVQMDLTGLCAAAAKIFHIKDHVLLKSLAVAALLGEVENECAYHNNMHFRKVVFQIMRMIATHNEIFKDTPKVFSEYEIALLLIAGCIHDLGHDGKGNKVDGIHVPAYLEKRAFELARPYLEKCGLNKASLDQIRVMLIATDVSPFGDINSPANQMKRSYQHHFLDQNSEQSATYKPVLAYGLEILEMNPRLNFMSLILHESDISISAGTDYRVSCYETALLWEEQGQDVAVSSDLLNFLDKICQRRFLSDVGQKLFSSNMARIIVLTEQDVTGGDHELPRAEHSAFILGADLSGADGTCVN